MLNATLQCSTSLDTLFNICCTAAVTFVARHMLSRVNSLDAPQFNHKTKSKQRNKTAGEPSSSHHIAEWCYIVTTLFPLTLVSGIRTHWMEFSKRVNSVNLTTSHYCRRSPPPNAKPTSTKTRYTKKHSALFLPLSWPHRMRADSFPKQWLVINLVPRDFGNEVG